MLILLSIDKLSKTLQNTKEHKIKIFKHASLILYMNKLKHTKDFVLAEWSLYNTRTCNLLRC